MEIETSDIKSFETLYEDSIYDEVEIEDMDYNEETETFYYPCPCGDRFQITMSELEDGEDIAHCPSCTLTICIIYEIEE